MTTERYYFTFYGLDLEAYTIDKIEEIWREEASKVYAHTGIYINTMFSIYKMICGYAVECADWEYSVRFLVTRNPIIYEDPILYQKALLDVLENVKTGFNNPFSSLSKETVDFYYFNNI